MNFPQNSSLGSTPSAILTRFHADFYVKAYPFVEKMSAIKGAAAASSVSVCKQNINVSVLVSVVS